MNTLLLQAQQGGAGWMNFAMIGVIFLIFYFFMIRPQQKRQKALAEQRNAIKKGDHVITVGGIYAKVTRVEDSRLELEIAHDVNIWVDKSSVNVLPESK